MLEKKYSRKYQKIIKVGNSLALTLDKDFVKQSNVKAGDIVVVLSDDESKIITIGHIDNLPKTSEASNSLAKRETQAEFLSKFPPDFMAWVEETLEDDAYVFRYLSNL